ncbi:type II toxin-antitoxin system HicB family antitoxin [Desulfonatronum sp. SC1]|uniref:type II toxin-antitoxin system HicB family antitoxin n=1 Tax=Desulfonatronum sp. SC1 TaxID=2109626 RepID=UPI000D3061C8|nr:type II toxin-antitoxin system HicB family antitoxin [Desulfonatronum sp. SC1]PTN32001.1 HicB family protein [Desulfonatronum sp. SC1]
MIQEYCQNAIARAEYKKLDDGTWFAEIPGFQGVWANGESIEACRQDLWSVLEEWLVMKIQDGDPLPCFNGLSLHVKEVAVA